MKENNKHNMTRRNPDGQTYRIPLVNGVSFRLDSTSMIPAVFGEIANRLGAYEKLGKEPEELEELLKKTV